MPKARSVTNPQKSGSVTNPVKLVNHCTDHGCTLLFKDSVAVLNKWMDGDEN